MARAPSTFRQRDMERAAKAMRRAGFRRFTLKAGEVTVIVDENEATVAAAEVAEADEWEGVDEAF